jgi:hypothetical protein
MKKRVQFARIFFLIAAIFCVTQFSALADNSAGEVRQAIPINDPHVKKSQSNVCYEKSNIGYKKTTVFTPYQSLSDCRDSGGRPAKNSNKK